MIKLMNIELEETLTLNTYDCTLIKKGNDHVTSLIQYLSSAVSGTLHNL